jgi:plasmid stabilization system protein ParE
MRANFTATAEQDVAEAVEWYEDRQPGLGDDLLGEVRAIVHRIELNPQQFPLIHENVRRGLLRRFPYAVFFRLTEDEALVVAVFHTSRDPGRLQARI